MIQPVTPRFLVDGDLIEIAAVVHNNSGKAVETDVHCKGRPHRRTRRSKRNRYEMAGHARGDLGGAG